MGKCNDAITAELYRVGARHDPSGWNARHVAAFEAPRDAERSIVGLIKILADYADHHEAAYDATVSQDHFLGAEWLTILRSVRQLLNGTLGRLDGGSLDRLLYKIANAAGFDDSDVH